jgi:hypothetical protein
VPLLTGDARGPPHRRPPISSTTSANLGNVIASLPLPDALAHLVHPYSPAHQRERQHAVTAVAAPRRRPCSTLAHRAHHPLIGTTRPIGHAEPVIPVGDLAVGENAPEQTCRLPSGRVKGTSANSFPVLRAHVQETKDPSLNVLVISCVQSCQLVKFIGMCRKIQKFVKPVLLETRIQAL